MANVKPRQIHFRFAVIQRGVDEEPLPSTFRKAGAQNFDGSNKLVLYVCEIEFPQ